MLLFFNICCFSLKKDEWIAYGIFGTSYSTQILLFSFIKIWTNLTLRSVLKNAKHLKRIYKMKSSHVTTEPLWDKVNCKSTILLRMIDTCLEFLEKSSINL